MAYRLEGSMLEVCTCNAVCSCWVGEDPDGGKCEGVMAWQFNQGKIEDVDVSGLTLAVAAFIPGNALADNWRAVVFVDDKASPEQEETILATYTGKKGGPVANLASLIGDVVAVERSPITFDIDRGKGRLKIGTAVDAEMETLVGSNGERMTLHNAAFSVIRNAPANVGKAPKLKASHAGLGFTATFGGVLLVGASIITIRNLGIVAF